MPEWIGVVSGLINMIGLVVILSWTYRLGKELGTLKTKVEEHDRKIDSNDRQTIACTELFRQISIDVSAIKAKIDILLDRSKQDS